MANRTLNSAEATAPVRPGPPSGWKKLRIAGQFLFRKPPATQPTSALPVVKLRQSDLLQAPNGSLWRLGHSTVLLKLDGGFWLTDPVFAERASPFSFLGPRRFHAPPISLAELPPLQAVILSHDHYDHLDKAAVRHLARKTRHFLAPTGVGDLLVQWGIDAAKVIQLGWWAETRLGAVRLVATPAQHFSGRGMSDANRRLWCSWVIQGDGLSVFFSGDSGYFAGFREIGDRYGPFDATLVETGAYDARWTRVHMMPEQSVQAHRDLRGRWMIPIHNGTFALAFHPWEEPLERALAAAAGVGVTALTPGFGERLDLRQPDPCQAWWRMAGEPVLVAT